MCNLDRIYALIVLESADFEEQPLKSMRGNSHHEIADGGYRPVLGSHIASSSPSSHIQIGQPHEKPLRAIRFARA